MEQAGAPGCGPTGYTTPTAIKAEHNGQQFGNKRSFEQTQQQQQQHQPPPQRAQQLAAAHGAQHQSFVTAYAAGGNIFGGAGGGPPMESRQGLPEDMPGSASSPVISDSGALEREIKLQKGELDEGGAGGGGGGGGGGGRRAARCSRRRSGESGGY
eukprot:SAG22_NODE_5713_length_966_cov_1.041522_2_plen_156_part_00